MTTKPAPTADLRPGYRYSDRPVQVHAGRTMQARKELPDLGTGLCGASVVLLGKGFLADYPMCPDCEAKKAGLAGTKRVGKQAMMDL